LALRWFGVSNLYALVLAIIFGITGIIIILFVSGRKGKMVHCAMYCPIGSIVNYTKEVNPFRLYIDKSCTLCMKCTVYCKYDALNPDDIRNKKPGRGCTLCGDCLAGCRDNSIRYGFLKLRPETSRSLYLFITISLHACFLALARI
jgi:polyferredoxin